MIYTIGSAGPNGGSDFRPLVHVVAETPASVPTDVRPARPDEEESRRFAALAQEQAAEGADAISIAFLIAPGTAVIEGEL